MTPLISVKGLKTYFRTDEGLVKACDNISFDVNPGEILGVVGESGSGKTVASMSILRLIAEPPGYFDGGEIIFEGKNLLKLSMKEMREIRGNKISMIFQDPMTALNPFLKIETQLTEVLVQHKSMSLDKARAKCIEMLKKVGVSLPERRLDMYPHQLSGGLRQRMMIAMALLCRPSLLIADEPTTALDVTIQAQILELIKSINQEFNTSVILISHDLGVVAGMTNRLVVMYAGKIVESGLTEDIFNKPSHPYTKALLNSIPRIDKEQKQLDPIPGLPPSLSSIPTGCPFHPRCAYAVEKCKTTYPETAFITSDHISKCWEVSRL
ncbi:MAG: ABC transporter ATP-binding protein [Bdellovibrionales bacterium]|nr:ABC transporter ATP-binding protein [Bdellovibrionales bacterium]